MQSQLNQMGPSMCTLYGCRIRHLPPPSSQGLSRRQPAWWHNCLLDPAGHTRQDLRCSGRARIGSPRFYHHCSCLLCCVYLSLYGRLN